MGTIIARKRKDDSVAFMARVRVMRDGVTYHETETFDRRPAAMSWIKKRELAKPGVITAYKAADPPLAKAIDRYTEESLKEIGRTKAQRYLGRSAGRRHSGHRKQVEYQAGNLPLLAGRHHCQFYASVPVARD